MWRAIIELFTVMFGFIGRGNRIEKRLESMDKRLQYLELDILRVKFLQLVQHSPREYVVICATYDEYKKNGGDSWVDDVYLKWKQEYVK